ncbi:MAG TPA: FkbM family methyltransferase [Solirubrobacteraceae bacterium]|nr:FkbM family methyltransferase [Solirubrobacteraceae bacterium]
MTNDDRRYRLSSGLAVYAASPGDARRGEYSVGEYFQSDLATLRPGATVFDIGANIGLFSLELLRRHGTDVRIFACEPAPRSFAFLQRNVRELFPDAAVSFRRCAVGERPGRTTLYFRPRVSQMSSLQREGVDDPDELIDAILKEPPAGFRPGASRLRRWLRPRAAALLKMASWWMGREVVEIPCEMTTVSEIIAQSDVETVDLLKVDVEGAELAVLQGIDADHWPKIEALLVEVHNHDGRVETIRGMLEAAGFARIDFSQEWPHEGTHIYMLEASRAARPVEAPASSA